MKNVPKLCYRVEYTPNVKHPVSEITLVSEAGWEFKARIPLPPAQAIVKMFGLLPNDNYEWAVKQIICFKPATEDNDG